MILRDSRGPGEQVHDLAMALGLSRKMGDSVAPPTTDFRWGPAGRLIGRVGDTATCGVRPFTKASKRGRACHPPGCRQHAR